MTTITRRKPASSSTTNSGGTYSDLASNSISQSNQNDRESRDRDDEGENDDEKETRLTLVEEVLLLGLKDREVRYRPYSPIDIDNLFIGLHIVLE